MSLAVASILAEAATRHAGRTAIVYGPQRISYADLWEQTRRYAAVLRSRGIGPGDRVAVMMPNLPDFPRSYYAVLALGAIVVPVNALLTPEEVTYVLGDSESKLLICAAPLLPVGVAGARAAGVPCMTVLAEPGAADGALDIEAVGVAPIDGLVQRSATDDAVVLYTSGTTGKPKGAVLTQSNLTWNATISAFDLFSVGPGDVFLGALPLFHTFGQTCVMNVGFRAGATVALLPRFDAVAALDLMVDEGVTIFAGVPTMYIALIEAARREGRTPRIRLGLSGGASLPLAVLEAFEEIFGAPIYEGYGLSETSPVASFNQPALGRKPGTVGVGIWGVDLAVADAQIDDRIELLPRGELGEIVIRGHGVFRGYLNRPEESRAALVDGWFRSGDLGTQDADGFITIVDRKKDMILRGGYNVYPREVEEVLMRHPAVAQVAVIGLPDGLHGEEVVAVVVARDDAPRDGAAIVAWSQEHLAKYKYPREVVFVDALPLGGSGKVLKRELRARLARRVATGLPAD